MRDASGKQTGRQEMLIARVRLFVLVEYNKHLIIDNAIGDKYSIFNLTVVVGFAGIHIYDLRVYIVFLCFLGG